MVVLAGGEQRFSEAVERLGFTGSVAELAEQGQRLLVMVGSLLVVAQPLIDDADVG